MPSLRKRESSGDGGSPGGGTATAGKPGSLRSYVCLQALFQRRYAAAIEILSNGIAVEPEGVLAATSKTSSGLSQQRTGDSRRGPRHLPGCGQDFRRQLDKIALDFLPRRGTHAFLGLAYAGLGDAAPLSPKAKKPWPCIPLPKIQ